MSFPEFRGVRPRFARIFTRFAAALLVFALGASARAAERPSAMRLFPEETFVFIRMANAREFGQRFGETSMGRMIRDPQLKPFVDSLYGKASDLYAQKAEGLLGISWDDLKKLPQGEVAFAVVARSGKPPALVLLVDQGDETSVANKLVDKALDIAQQKGGEFTKEKIGDVDVTVVRDHERQNRMLGVFQRENTIVVATDPNVLRNILWHWDHPGETFKPDSAKSESAPGEPASAGGSAAGAADAAGNSAPKDKPEKKPESEFVPTRTLAENVHFATILKECRRKQDPPPHLIFFADPIGLMRNLGRESSGMQLVLAMLPSLGIDGLIGIGGALTYATNEYDDLSQVHILLENPRAGVLQLPAFEAGDTAPQNFVPLATETYMALHWNVRATYDRLGALVERFGQKATMEKFVKEKLSERLGIDVVSQVIDNLKGRFTWMIGYDRPSRVTGHQHVVAAELRDEKVASEALKTFIGKFPDQFEERRFGSATYYALIVQSFKDMPEDKRPINPFIGIMDRYLFFGTSSNQFERCIAARDGTAARLADSDDYTRTSAVIGRETAGTTPVMFSVSRPEETLRQWYDLLTSPRTKEVLSERKEQNPIFAALLETLEQNQLPPFDVIAPYMAPGGGILYDTDNGYHGISFTLRNKTEP